MRPYPLYKGATRVPTFGGVPTMPLILMVITVASVAMVFGAFSARGLLWSGLIVPGWAVMAAVTKTDDRAFRIVGLWVETKFRNRNKQFWSASSYAPADYSRKARSESRFCGIARLRRPTEAIEGGERAGV